MKDAPVTLRDHPPLKQGLRLLHIGRSTTRISTLRDHPPLKQGLRQRTGRTNLPIGRAPRPSSTKTRIKTIDRHSCYTKIAVLRDHPPLKQGLRLAISFTFTPPTLSAPRPSSTKTRIKTTFVIHYNSGLSESPRPSSTKTRIKTSCRQCRSIACEFSETILH